MRKLQFRLSYDTGDKIAFRLGRDRRPESEARPALTARNQA